MKFVLRAAVLVLLVAHLAPAGETGKLKWKSFDEGISEAKKSKKKILVDVYTDWCGWCKRMDAQTYSNDQISSYLRDRYVVVKLNAESAKTLTYKGRAYSERDLSAAFGITGYPSTIFLRNDGEAITVYPGFADAKQFTFVLSFIAEDHYLSRNFDDYVAGRR